MQGELLMVVERLGLATLLGSSIGLNRKLHGKPVGIRTHSLIALGSATFVWVSYGVAGAPVGAPVPQVVQGIVTGIGFVGAGVILHRSGGKSRITGLTTASALWFTAALGVACGAGLFVPAVVATVIALIVLIIGGPIEGYIEGHVHKEPPIVLPPESPVE
ncbi:MAG TPA: MgtC/SapB family protein [Gemmatimonadaceae bacterium]|nr:MgtC/SapB family protein [Gemmatimonadaceae bacterium]